MADISPCVKQILCGLSDAVLRSLQAIITGQAAILQAQITIFQAQLLQYDVLSLPVKAVQQATQAVVTKVRNSAFLIPLNIISASDCVDLGNFNLNLQQSIDVALAVADDTLGELNRLLSYRTELNAIINELNLAIDQFSNISSIIDQCLSGG